MRISSTSLVLALLAGCNWVYGLDATTIGNDGDGDGIADVVDNCPSIANPDQLDTNEIDEGGDACAQCPNLIGIDHDQDLYDDGCDRCLGPGPTGEDVDADGLDDGCDPCIAGVSTFASDFNGNGIGDGCEVCFEQPSGDDDQDGLDNACDKCSSGPPHDEDGDGIDDACDNCPLEPNPSQAAPPGSPVGQDCNGGITGKLDRLFFDPFLVRNPFRWSGIYGMWMQLPDREVLSGAGGRNITAGFQGQFRLAMRVRFTRDDSELSIEGTGTTFDLNCVVQQPGTVRFGTQQAPITLGPEPFTIEVYYSDASVVFGSRCVVHAGDQVVDLIGGKLDGNVRAALRGINFELQAFDFVAAVPDGTTN